MKEEKKRAKQNRTLTIEKNEIQNLENYFTCTEEIKKKKI